LTLTGLFGMIGASLVAPGRERRKADLPSDVHQ
jgi:hypothetical protein